MLSCYVFFLFRDSQTSLVSSNELLPISFVNDDQIDGVNEYRKKSKTEFQSGGPYEFD